jgi:hypothetical protein
MWIYALALAGNSILALGELYLVYMFFRVFGFLARLMPGGAAVSSLPLWRTLVAALLVHTGIGILYAANALLQWYRLYRWGRVPRRLTTTASGVVLSQMGWLGPVHRFWPASAITAVELRQVVGNLLPNRTVAYLKLRRRRRFATPFRLSSRDPQLPKHIAERLAATLGCPLKIR